MTIRLLNTLYTSTPCEHPCVYNSATPFLMPRVRFLSRAQAVALPRESYPEPEGTEAQPECTDADLPPYRHLNCRYHTVQHSNSTPALPPEKPCNGGRPPVWVRPRSGALDSGGGADLPGVDIPVGSASLPRTCFFLSGGEPTAKLPWSRSEVPNHGSFPMVKG